ncbi:MAG: hypothetical protein ACE14V_07670 [bacterium]
MKPKYLLALLYSYVVLMVLASTKFTAISWLWSDHSWTWNYAQYALGNGWGYQYQSNYTLSVVLVYIIAYIIGIIAFSIAKKHTAKLWNIMAIILNSIGLVSFLIEGSHWLWEHHLTLILSIPTINLILAAIIIIQLHLVLHKLAKQQVELNPIPVHPQPVSSI